MNPKYNFELRQFAIGICLLLYGVLFAQSPVLELGGGSPVLVKGEIDTAVLSEEIIAKQSEVRERVFQNMIVRDFRKGKHTKRLNNFTTYHYLFGVMEDLTGGQRKDAIAEDLIRHSVEFAYVFGLALLVEADAMLMSDSDSLKGLSPSEMVFAEAGASYSGSKVVKNEKVRDFNVLLDLCYDVVLRSNANPNFSLAGDTSDVSFREWYKKDNVYIREMSSDEPSIRKEELKTLHKKVTMQYKELLEICNAIETLQKRFKAIRESGNPILKTEATGLLKGLEEMNGKQLKDTLNDFALKYDALLSEKDKSAIHNVSGVVGKEFDMAKDVIWFYTQLRKIEHEKVRMTEKQFLGMESILDKFLTLAKNNTKNDVVSSVVGVLLDHSWISYGKDGDQVNNGSSSASRINIDVEGLIISLYHSFLTKKENEGLRVYVKPVLTVGTNYAVFLSDNSLTTNEEGPQSLQYLYYASEKVGVKWKIWNWEYTHSFKPGKRYEYYGTSRFRKEPGTKPLINDIHLTVYGAGLLYNLANLKSDKEFNSPFVGTSLGVTFFNHLSANAGLAVPVSADQFKLENSFINLGFDISIFEYLRDLRKSKKK